MTTGDINKAFMLLDILNYVGMGAILLLIICLILSMFRKRELLSMNKVYKLFFIDSLIKYVFSIRMLGSENI